MSGKKPTNPIQSDLHSAFSLIEAMSVSMKIQTRLKGLLLQRFKRYMESHGLSQYQAAADLIVRGLIDFEREKAVEAQHPSKPALEGKVCCSKS